MRWIVRNKAQQFLQSTATIHITLYNAMLLISNNWTAPVNVALPEPAALYVGSQCADSFSRFRRLSAPAALSVMNTTGIDPKHIWHVFISSGTSEISWLPDFSSKHSTVTLILSPPIPLRLYTLPYWSNPTFLMSDIRAQWRSKLCTRAPKCQKQVLPQEAYPTIWPPVDARAPIVAI